jgi:hypothetical protein
MSDNNGIIGYLEAIDRADDELLSLRGSYMAQCKGPRASIAEIKGAAREAGINMKAFNVVLKGHRADRAHEKRIAALEAEDAAAYEELEAALGDFGGTPLGSAALEGARPRRGREDALDDLQA